MSCEPAVFFYPDTNPYKLVFCANSHSSHCSFFLHLEGDMALSASCKGHSTPSSYDACPPAPTTTYQNTPSPPHFQGIAFLLLFSCWQANIMFTIVQSAEQGTAGVVILGDHHSQDTKTDCIEINNYMNNFWDLLLKASPPWHRIAVRSFTICMEGANFS